MDLSINIKIHINIHIYIYTHIYIHIQMCLSEGMAMVTERESRRHPMHGSL